MQDLTVAGLQYNIAWKDKRANLEQVERMLEGLKADIIVLPEMFQTGFCFEKEELAEDLQNSETFEWMREQSQASGAVLTGSFIVNENGRYFNRLIWMQPDGNYHQYDKKHLFSMSEEPNHFAPGTNKLLVEWKGWKICPMICYDLRFPVWIRNVEHYDMALFVANWPKRRSMHWEKLLQARAIENQCYVVGVNRCGTDGNDIYHDGRSAIVNPLGEVLEEAIDESKVLLQTLSYEELKKTRRYMPFLRDADAFTLR